MNANYACRRKSYVREKICEEGGKDYWLHGKNILYLDWYFF